jgi:hypothetical protein
VQLMRWRQVEGGFPDCARKAALHPGYVMH